MHVLLIGARASGKSTIGRRLARALERPFVDLDDRTLARFGEASVSEVFVTRGETAWREAEVEALRDVMREPAQVVALGGGTPVASGAAELINNTRRAGQAIVIYLRNDADILAGRLRRRAGDRPSLTGAEPAAEIAAVLAQREPAYRALADLVFDADRVTVPQAAAELARMLKDRPGSG